MLSGSSPRMRGTHDIPIPHIPRDGIIPAYAGNTHAVVPSPCCARDHPRVCGEHVVCDPWLSPSGDHPRVCGEHDTLTTSTPEFTGSSPRMRGTPPHTHKKILKRGIIPAYAGNTIACPRICRLIRDHPRVCGEHVWSARIPDQTLGSSPRMRGTRLGGLRPDTAAGIIPAYAGNTHIDCARLRTGGDHPRVCGEHVYYH